MPEQIIPLPKENRIKQRATKRTEKTAIITKSPYKNELIALKETKEKKKANQHRRKVTKNIALDLVSAEQDKVTKKTKERKRKLPKLLKILKENKRKTESLVKKKRRQIRPRPMKMM